MRCYGRVPILAADIFAIIAFGTVAGVIIVLLLIGQFYPGTGAEQLDWRPTRSPELEAQNEVDDLQQMFDAANEKRRARGKAELTLGGVEQSARDFQREQVQRAGAYQADEEVAQMLDAKNARRARKGLEPLTREQYEASLRGDQA